MWSECSCVIRMARKIFRRAADRRQALPDLARSKPGVNQHAGGFGFDVGAIAGRTAAQNGESDGHKRTVTALAKARNSFSRQRLKKMLMRS